MTSNTWVEVSFSELFRIKHGYAFKSKFFSSDGREIVLTPGNFQETGGLKLKGDKEKFYKGDYPKDYLLKTGDLLIVMTDLTQDAAILGAPAFVDKCNRYLHNQRLGKITDLDESRVTIRFLYHLLNFHGIRAQIKGSATGATVRHTSPDRILEVKTKIPPLSIQRQVAELLDGYNTLIENNNRRIAILEDMAQSLYREWFVNFRYPNHEDNFDSEGKPKLIDSPLGQIPEGWQVKRLDDYVELQRGFDLPKGKRNEEGGIPIYAASGLTGYHDEVKVRGPGIVTGRSGTLGIVKLVLEDHWPLNTSLWVKHFNNCTAHYAYYLLDSIGLERFNSGASVPTLNRNDVHGKPVISPPNELIERFEEIAAVLHKQINVLGRKNDNLKKQRDMLLPKLISGQIKL